MYVTLLPVMYGVPLGCDRAVKCMALFCLLCMALLLIVAAESNIWCKNSASAAMVSLVLTSAAIDSYSFFFIYMVSI